MDSKTVESKVEPVSSQFGLGYITSYKSNLESLKTEVQKLEATKNSVRDSVDEATKNGEVIVNVVEIWLKKVDATVAEANKLIIENDVHANCMRYFPNLRFRHQHSKKSQKITQEIYQVLEEGNFDRISYSKPSTLKEIQQALKDPNIFKIGLYGTDGVGKTTLVKELAREVEKDGSFDAVVMAEVDNSPDVENIQGQIANALGLKLDEETKERRVDQLRQRIRKEKNILVILDDICGKLDLAEVGIPFGDDHKGYKLVLTSEYLNVLKCQMGTQKDFKLEVLSDNDSWKLFEKIAGDDIRMNNKDKSIAQNVAKCCDGLSLFIVIVAKALRKKHVSTWKENLIKLKRFYEQG
ncbi:disease resistance protein At4g27190-like [Glycine soja]|uniref:disease resistance protein At4g27190-like n=1 Tax=Glycine soja TaxID=3848 RepID=UPI00103BC4FB|nr:disease resistance protein At4g27190-like [Glycine soja]